MKKYWCLIKKYTHVNRHTQREDFVVFSSLQLINFEN